MQLSTLSAILIFASIGLTGISQACISVRGKGNVYAQASHEQMVSETNCIIVKYRKGEARIAAVFNTLAENISQAIHFNYLDFY